MWPKRKKEKEQVPEEEIVMEEVPKPKPHLTLVKSNKISDYYKLAEELHFDPEDLLVKKLLGFLAENKIPTFNTREVYNYLKNEARKRDKIWLWKPLRKKDRLNQGEGINGIDGSSDSHGKCYPWYDIYNKIVPYEILEDVKKIETYMPNTFRFYVSDYEVPTPDPFIMATTGRPGSDGKVDVIIFGMWDEPGFGKVGGEVIES